MNMENMIKQLQEIVYEKALKRIRNEIDIETCNKNYEQKRKVVELGPTSTTSYVFVDEHNDNPSIQSAPQLDGPQLSKTPLPKTSDSADVNTDSCSSMTLPKNTSGKSVENCSDQNDEDDIQICPYEPKAADEEIEVEYDTGCPENYEQECEEERGQEDSEENQNEGEKKEFCSGKLEPRCDKENQNEGEKNEFCPGKPEPRCDKENYQEKILNDSSSLETNIKGILYETFDRIREKLIEKVIPLIKTSDEVCSNCPNLFSDTGIRYKCPECPNFYLCVICEDNEIHPHDMLKQKIPKTENSGCDACTLCNTSITDILYLCNECVNFHLCGTCEEKENHSHDLTKRKIIGKKHPVLTSVSNYRSSALLKADTKSQKTNIHQYSMK